MNDGIVVCPDVCLRCVSGTRSDVFGAKCVRECPYVPMEDSGWVCYDFCGRPEEVKL